MAFSVYIWNVDLIKILIDKLKKMDPQLVIVIGGPEVSYEIDYFLDNFKIDYLISGEGEVAFKELLDCLETQQPIKELAEKISEIINKLSRLIYNILKHLNHLIY